MTDQEWDKLSDEQKNAKVASLLWPDAPPGCFRSQGCNVKATNLTSTWRGAGLVIDAMTKPNPRHNLMLSVHEESSVASWFPIVPGATSVEARVIGPPDKAAPSAIALAAVRAMEAKA